MLEKNEKKLIFDAHFHYFECKKLEICQFPQNWSGISCAHSEDEWYVQKMAQENVIQAFGIHPQQCGFVDIKAKADFLENLIEKREIAAIGETGFDFYKDEFKNHSAAQEEAFNIQLDLAEKFSLPLIIHCRKGNEKLFQYAKRLSHLPEVLFHSFMGTSIEGKSLLGKNINAYFSFGKQIFNNNKKVLDCVKNLPYDRVLGETDAPFQYLKGEAYTRPDEIVSILKEIDRLNLRQ